MTADDVPTTGFEAVDEHPETKMLLDAMDETARWDAVKQLRSFEREHLALSPGQRLLDVGCGLGDASLALAADLGTDGQLVGIDFSEAMLAEATRRAAAAGCRARYAVGDACALAEPDASFDAVRSERVLQWVPDPERAIAEMARVVRPGGLLCLADSDFSTMRLTIGDPGLEGRLHATMGVDRDRQTTIGGRLDRVAEAVGLALVAQTSATHVWSAYDPDASPRLPGWAPWPFTARLMVEAGELAPEEVDGFISAVEHAGRAGRFRMELTMFAVVARRP